MKKISKKGLRDWGIFLIATGITMIAIGAFFKNVVQFSAVVGPSMESSYYDGEIVVVNKMNYDTPEDVERFDVVVFFNEETLTYIIKRVYGLPGEIVEINSDGTILVNKTAVEDEYGVGNTEPGLACEPIVLGENEFFVLGDNREHSDDSRKEYIGAVSFEDFVGQVTKKVVENPATE